MEEHQEDPHLNSATILALNRIMALEQRILRLEHIQRDSDARSLALGATIGALSALLIESLLRRARRGK